MEELNYIRKVLKERLEKLEKLKTKAKRSLENAPEGKLVISTSHKTTQYFYKKDKEKKKGNYISNKNEKLIAKLAQKDYDIIFLQATESEIRIIEKILKLVPDKSVSTIYEELAEGRKRFVKPHILTDMQFVQKWLSVKYDNKGFEKNAPVILTEKGERVRSKSEKIIADKLYRMGIPYRYEYPIKLGGYGIVYPDFTLLKVSTREEIYFEHFGMMDNASYCEKAIKKIEDYVKSGYCMGKNILVTFETSQHPLDMQTMERMIKEVMK